MAMLCGSLARAQETQRVDQEDDQAAAGLRMVRPSWSNADHPSGIYHVKAEARLTIVVENPSDEPADIDGEIHFGIRPLPAGGDGPFKTVSVTPIEPAVLAAHQRAQIPLVLTFGAPGTYELRWKRGADFHPIDNEDGISLQCIFAPRAALPPDESPWMTALPRPAVHVRGYLKDYIAQTTIHRFLVEEELVFDPVTGVVRVLGALAGASPEEVAALCAQAAGAQARLILRVTVPTTEPTERQLAAFSAHIVDAARRGQGVLSAIAIAPALQEGADHAASSRALRAYYFAGYAAAKRADRNIIMLGAGSAADTARLLVGGTPDPVERRQMLAYLDALAISDTTQEPHTARALLGEARRALYVLPSRDGVWPPPAAALAHHPKAAAVPPADIDHGVTAHLLGGTVFFQRLRLAAPPDIEPPEIPFIAIFQGDGYAVAAVAGFSAGTDLDGLYPQLAETPPAVAPWEPDDRPPYPHLLVSDDSRSMRVVDDQGAPVDCRIGDRLHVPTADHVVYVLRAGDAEELAGVMRPAIPERLALFLQTATRTAEGVMLKLTNVAPRELGGRVRLIRPSATPGQPEEILADQEFVAVSPGKTLEFPIPLVVPPQGSIIVEIRTAAPRPLVQRTPLVIGPATTAADRQVGATSDSDSATPKARGKKPTRDLTG